MKLRKLHHTDSQPPCTSRASLPSVPDAHIAPSVPQGGPTSYPSPHGLDRINTDEKFDPAKTTFYLWRFLFRQAAEIGNIWHYYVGPLPPPEHEDVARRSTSATGLCRCSIRNVSAEIAQGMMVYQERTWPASEAWAQLEATYQAADVGAKVALQDDRAT